jgi:hypothetical protein
MCEPCFGRKLEHLTAENRCLFERERKMESYSPFFQTLHDERSPAGHLGNGTHASILRAIVFSDPHQRPLSSGVEVDFAVIWDADHDTRVIKAVEAIYRAGFLSAILMIGERKGTLHAIVSENVQQDWEGDQHFKYLETKLHDVAQSMEGDPWSSSLRRFASPGREIIDDDEEKVRLYLSNLKMLWRLGVLMITFDDHLRFKQQQTVGARRSFPRYMHQQTVNVAARSPDHTVRLEPADFDVLWKAAEKIAIKEQEELERSQ